jgi:ketosteroid isomerase-like protein
VERRHRPRYQRLGNDGSGAMQEQMSTDLVERTHALFRFDMDRNLEAWASLWADDAVVTFPHDPARPSNDTHGKAAQVEAMRQKMIERERVELDVRTEPLADGRRVLAHIDVRISFVDGRQVRGPMLSILTFDETGLISAVEEYFVVESFVVDRD